MHARFLADDTTFEAFQGQDQHAGRREKQSKQPQNPPFTVTPKPGSEARCNICNSSQDLGNIHQYKTSAYNNMYFTMAHSVSNIDPNNEQERPLSREPLQKLDGLTASNNRLLPHVRIVRMHVSHMCVSLPLSLLLVLQLKPAQYHATGGTITIPISHSTADDIMVHKCYNIGRCRPESCNELVDNVVVRL
ncbi:hypothetical protein NM208_g8664 [Fusarium decemcellulare]|uniref:Uncharacterized protein n=1 Tax=Fusarium decemcellulare TaxID=57161 RepID=A0ACC1S4G6_9HYPO|nr:hypothetical protein NM208_g8664 [Fusarium decemcellulare]